MHEVFPRIHIGALSDCVPGTADHLVIHACKAPCHKRRVGYATTVARDHPQYLFVDDEWELFLNLIDPRIPLFRPESFWAIRAFLKRHGDHSPVLIHCNQGESRAPTVALLCAQWRHHGTWDSWGHAKEAMTARYPRFHPGAGLDRFMEDQWTTFTKGVCNGMVDDWPQTLPPDCDGNQEGGGDGHGQREKQTG